MAREICISEDTISQIIKMKQYTENANLQGNAETIHKTIADIILKKFALEKLEQDLQVAHISGDLHIHDLEYFCTRPFCQDHDLRYFFYYGLMPDGRGTKTSVAGPAKKPEVAILHAVKALGSAQTNFAGGQGFYNFLTFIAPYLEGLSYEEIKQLMQMFVYEMTQMMVARGGQLVFSSVQLTPGVPTIWRDKPVVYKGRIWNGEDAPLRTYGEFEKEVRLAFKALMEVMLEGDYWGKPFNFPKPEIGLMKEFMSPEYEELYKLACEVAAKTGAIYFDNMLPIYRSPPNETVISCVQCCSYAFTSKNKTDPKFLEKLFFKNGQHFSMGGAQVITINLPRIVYKVLLQNPKDNDEKMKFLRHEIDMILEKIIRIFKIKKYWMNIMKESEKMPFITQVPQKGAPPLVDLENLNYIVGIVGVNEAVSAFLGEDIITERGRFIGTVMISDINIKIMTASQKEKMNIQLARTPAETVAGRFAALDLKYFKEVAKKYIRGDVKKALELLEENDDIQYDLLPVYYTNGTHVPVDADISLGKKIQIESEFFALLPAGNICHIFLGEKEPSGEGLWNFVKKISQNTEIGYFAFTKDFTQCYDCHCIEQGLKEKCNFCNSQKIEHFSRITGYVSAISGWNSAKKQELKDRYRYSSLC